MPRSRGEILAAAQAAATRAVERGAISQGRLRWWVGQAEAGIDVAPWLDELSPVNRPAAAQRHAPPGEDPVQYSANPLLAEVRRAKPALVAAAEAEGPAPRLFGGADLPPFTASGLPPELLAAQPWPIRRALAEAPTRAAAYEIMDRYSGEGGSAMAAADHAKGPLNAGYVSAMSEWLAGPGPAPAQPGPQAAAAQPSQYTVEQLHAELFGDQLPEARKLPEAPRPR
jgi:hypothetical protein